MSDVTRASILAQIRSLNDAAAELSPPPVAGGEDFAATLKASLSSVNELQHQSNDMAVRFQTGVDDTSVVDVMLASQKSSLAFHAATEVRNKLITAYQEIMNMPV